VSAAAVERVATGTMFHVVERRYRELKLAEGLRDVGSGLGYWQPGVYLWAGLAEAERYREWMAVHYVCAFDIIEVEMTGLPLVRDPWFAGDGPADAEERARWNDSWISA